MLQKLYDLLKNSQGEMTKTDLCRELNISPARLDNMLEILAQTGKIKMVMGREAFQCTDATSCPSTGKACPGPAHCALLMHMPVGIKIDLDA
jgi:hypothetical protein